MGCVLRRYPDIAAASHERERDLQHVPPAAREADGPAGGGGAMSLQFHPLRLQNVANVGRGDPGHRAQVGPPNHAQRGGENSACVT